jgi:RNA polymerase sigma-70 factor (ECF subfamily)
MSEPADAARRRARFEALCGSLRPDLFRFAFWLSRDRSVAEDVVQDTLLRAWRSLESLGDDAAARPWLLTIARREFARRFERRRFETIDIDQLSASEDPALAAAEEEDVSELRAAIMTLDVGYREPLVLQVLMGYTTEEIAAHMGLKPGAVLTRLFRAREKLRAAVTAGGGAP